MPTTSQTKSATSKPLVSIIVPAYNVEKYIEEALLSVTSQSIKNIEIIVIDDGSTDKTQSIIEHIVEHDKRVTLVSQANSGKPSIARNNGISKATGKYLAFMDADDIMLPGKIEAQVNAFKELDDVSFMFHDWSFISEDGRILTKSRLKEIEFTQQAANHITHYRDNIYTTNHDYYNYASTNKLGVLTIAVMMKQEILLAEQEWFPEDMDIGEDLDLWYRLLLKHKAAYINQTFCQYRTNPNSITKNSERMVLGQIDAKTRNLIRGTSRLSTKEKKIINHQIALKYRNLAYKYYAEDVFDTKLARKYYAKCLLLYPSIRHLISVVKTYIPAFIFNKKRKTQ